MKSFSREAVQKLSAAKLLDAIAKQDIVVRGFVDIMIDSGRGHELMAETRAAAIKGHDSLAIDYMAAMDYASFLNSEKKLRLHYRGNLKPIKKQA
jgi:hypothetical protein